MAELHLYIRTQLVTDQATAEALAAQADALKSALVAAGGDPNAVTATVVAGLEPEPAPVAETVDGVSTDGDVNDSAPSRPRRPRRT